MTLKHYTVLMVENNRNSAALLQKAYQHLGFTNPIHLVTDGRDAVDYLAGNWIYENRNLYPLPMLVLLDLDLPRISGFEVLKWVRQQSGLEQLRIVVFCDSQKQQDIDRAYAYGANSYLYKPSGFKALLEMVKALHEYWVLLSERPSLTALAPDNKDQNQG